MLKLIYHNAVFGPIDLEYCKPVIRVGSSEDNDLVLRHPSVKPHHGWLIFRGERVILTLQGEDGDLPVETGLNAGSPSPRPGKDSIFTETSSAAPGEGEPFCRLSTDVLEVMGTELGVGEQLWIGDLQFSLAYSSTTVALPDIPAPLGRAGCLPGLPSEGRFQRAIKKTIPPEAPDDSPAEIEAGSDVGQSMQLEKRSSSPRPSKDSIFSETSSAAPGEGAGSVPSRGASMEERLYCSNCHTFVPVAGVKRIGLVGQPKLALCPKCSRALNAEPTSAPARTHDAGDHAQRSQKALRRDP